MSHEEELLDQLRVAILKLNAYRPVIDAAKRWANAETPSEAIRWSMELRVALEGLGDDGPGTHGGEGATG